MLLREAAVDVEAPRLNQSEYLDEERLVQNYVNKSLTAGLKREVSKLGFPISLRPYLLRELRGFRHKDPVRVETL